MTPPDRESGAVPDRLEHDVIGGWIHYPKNGRKETFDSSQDDVSAEIVRRYNAFAAMEARAIRAEGALGEATGYIHRVLEAYAKVHGGVNDMERTRAAGNLMETIKSWTLPPSLGVEPMKSRAESAESTLAEMRAHGCQDFSEGDCWSHGRRLDATFGADLPCYSCWAGSALIGTGKGEG